MSESLLDSEELPRVAVLDMKEGRHEDAIGRLKRVIERDPKSASARLLLGAEHAELGLFDRAMEEFQHALALDASLAVARFQLGLIHYVQNDRDRAAAVWSALPGLPGAEALNAFACALQHAAAGQLDSALSELDAGLAAQPSAALAKDMLKIKLQLEEQAKHNPDAKQDTGENKHALLSSYAELSQTKPRGRPN
jgi:tetratricopeptide (TPR) repeat protein